MKNTALLIALLMFGLVGLSTACSNSGTAQNAVVKSSVSFPEKGNFRLSLTDAPHPSLTSVFVTIDHVELLLAKGGKEGRLILGQNMGTIDLLKLRDGVHLPIRDLDLQEDVVVKQFRLILKDTGHWLVRKDDGSTCDLKTPSQQKTGLKLIIGGGGVQIEAGSLYSLIVDFDVDHSIVDNKNNCLLKPVLKVKSLVKVPEIPDGTETPEDPTDGGSTDGGSTDGGSTDGGSTDGGSTDGGSTDGGSTDGGSTDGGSTDGGSTDGGSTDGGSTDGGSTDGGSTDGGSTDGGSTDDTGDGAPPVMEGDPAFFNNP